MRVVHINSMNGDSQEFRYYLRLIRENSQSVYCKSEMFGDDYRIEKESGKVFCNGVLIANSCQYEIV